MKLLLHANVMGDVCFTHNGSEIYNSALSPVEFLHPALSDNLDEAEVLGEADNAALLCELYRVINGGRKLAVSVVSPTRCYRRPAVPDPVQTLKQLWQTSPSAMAISSMHGLTQDDYWQYDLIQQVRAGAGDVQLMSTLQHHPVWPAIRFLRTFNIRALCSTLVRIVDPRWYRHPRRPSRLSRFMSRLQLGPVDRHAVHLCDGSPGKVAYQAWQTDEPFRDRPIDPHMFLLRTLWLAGPLKATRHFARYLYLTWMSQLHSHLSFNPYAFDPAQFFKDPAEVAAFQASWASDPQPQDLVDRASAETNP